MKVRSLRFRIKSLEFGVYDAVQASVLKDWVLGFRIGASAFRFQVTGFRFQVSGFGFRVQIVGLRVLDIEYGIFGLRFKVQVLVFRCRE